MAEPGLGNGKGGISRRSFMMLLGAAGLGAWAATRPNISAIAEGLGNIDNEAPRSFEARMVNGVEVYGLDESIASVQEADYLCANFNAAFLMKLTDEQRTKSVWEQREILLPRDTRFIEFVVNESTYRSFQDRKVETGVDYIEWIKLHVDLMNRAAERAKPKCSVKTKIARLIVVSDQFKSNPIKYTNDIDAEWFDSTDYRVNQNRETFQGHFWSFKHNPNGELTFRYPPKGDRLQPDIVLPPGNDTFEKVRDEVWVDGGLMHELGHQGWNIVDEYSFDIRNAPFGFKNLLFYTGSFHKPELSPYLSTLVNFFIKEGVRGYYTDPRGIGSGKTLNERFFHFGLLPKNISLNVTGATEAILYKNIYKSTDYYKDKNFVDAGRVEVKGNKVSLNQEHFKPQSTIDGDMFPTMSLLKIKVRDQWKELFLPTAMFNMVKFAGIDNAVCDLQIGDMDTSKSTTLQFEMVDDKDISTFMDFRQSHGFLPYAIMKIDGLSTWFIWSMQK